MMEQWRLRLARYARGFLILLILASNLAFAQQTPDTTTIILGVDASVKNRIDRLAGYTVMEH